MGGFSVEEVAPLYELYKAVSPARPLQLPETQYLAELLSRVGKESPSIPDLVAMRLVKWRELRNVAGETARLVGARNAALAEKVARCIEHYANFGDMLLTDLSSRAPLLDEVLSILVRSANAHSISNIAEVLTKYDELYARLEVEPTALLLKLDKCIESPTDGISTNNIAEFFEQELLFEHAPTVDCRIRMSARELALADPIGGLFWQVLLPATTCRSPARRGRHRSARRFGSPASEWASIRTVARPEPMAAVIVDSSAGRARAPAFGRREGVTDSSRSPSTSTCTGHSGWHDLNRLSINQLTTRDQWTLPEAVDGYARAGVGAMAVWWEKLREVGVEQAARVIRDAGMTRHRLLRRRAADPA